MYLTPFVSFFREQGQKETRVITTRGYPGLPDDEYALIEAYCTDPTCDCRRVMLNVVGRRQASQPGSPFLASIGFGFDRDSDLAGPYLDPLNPQGQYADVLFPLVSGVLAQPSYVARLESHYQQLKRAAANPLDPAYEMIRRLRIDENRGTAAGASIATGAPKRAGGRRKAKGRKHK